MLKNCKTFGIVLLAFICYFVFGQNFCIAKKHVSTPESEYKYQQKVLRRLEVEKYEKSLLPESGFMLYEDYEKKSEDASTLAKDVPEPKLPKDIKMKYVPQPIFKMVRYNNPPGSPEITLQRAFKFDRQENGEGITSPDRSMMIYPAIYYYANSQSVETDLYRINLDKTLPDVDRILRANVIKREPEPIISTEKSINQQYSFKTLTPIDFSPDSTKLLAKEKVGYTYDGIWKTDIWVYDFNTKTATKLPEVRDAIVYYWKNTKGVNLNDKMWDIFPLGFDAENPDRIVVDAYGYTGSIPKFLGAWSVDYKGNQTQLVSLFNPSTGISINGFKLVKSGVVNPADVYADEKRLDKLAKKKRKSEQKNISAKKKQAKKELKARLNEMKKEESQTIKQYHGSQKFMGITGKN